MKTPLADRIRPKTLDEVVGQKHLIGEGKILRNIIENDEVPNMIFYGPSGVGKTTIANIIAQKTGKTLHRLNATTASVADIKNIVSTLDSFLAMDGVLLYLDEIQHFNKKQQQSLLEFMENGKITLIASTTENPYFYVYNAVLSRSVVFEFKQIEPSEIEKALERAVEELKESDYKGFDVTVDKDAIRHMAHVSNGDVRKALNSLEVAFIATPPNKDKKIHISLDTAVQATQKKAMRYDRDGDSHYDILSAFQKSIRGSDPDAAVYYLARMLYAGESVTFIARRIMICASEDVGNADPQALQVAVAAAQAVERVGMPESQLILSQAAIYVACAPKSNAATNAIFSAMESVKNKKASVPPYLQDAHYGGAGKLGRGIGYEYAHDFPKHFSKQRYLPYELGEVKFYEPSDSGYEQQIRKHLDWLHEE